MIGGTQLIPIKWIADLQEKSEYHIILKNFEFEDFQFKGEILNSGYKIYRSEDNFMNKLFLLIECEISKNYYDTVEELTLGDAHD